MDTHHEGLAKATAAAIAAARKVVIGDGIPEFLRRKHSKSGAGCSVPPMKAVRDLTDQEWGLVVAAVIFSWVKAVVEQAIAEGRDGEEAVCATGLSPEPADVAVITAILPALADEAKIDWSLSLNDWSREMMTGFLLAAWHLIELVRDHGPVLRQSELATNGNDAGAGIPF
jgi:hypothetical protein